MLDILWAGYERELETLLLYGLGIAAYAAVIVALYERMASTDPFHSKPKPGVWGKVVHHAETIFVFPLMSFLYFAILSVATFFLGKGSTTGQILLLSMAVVVGVRVTAHLRWMTSVEVSKMIPLGLLAVFIVQPGYLSISETFAHVAEAVSLWPLLVRYFGLFVALEALLRGMKALAPKAGKLRARWRVRHGVSKRALMRTVKHDHHEAAFKKNHWDAAEEGVAVPLAPRKVGVGPAYDPAWDRATK